MSRTDRIPLYQQIQNYIREQIDSQGLKAGDRIPTEKELMERFNVSKITVVNALSGLANENRIRRVPGRGSFVGGADVDAAPADIGGQQTERRGTGVPLPIIGIVIPSIVDYFAIRLIDGIQATLAESGYRSMILLSDGDLDREKEAITTLKQIGAQGLLIFPVDEEQYNEEILSMKLAGFPFMLMDRYLPGVETHYIAADGRKGTKLAVDHLWDLGHREIAICSDSPLQTVTIQERIDGYMAALKDKGALINPAHIITGFRLENMKEADKHPLFRYIRNRMATAYISLNGRLGVQICQMARRAGLRVPEDVSVISFDDPTSIIEDYGTLTHIKQFERDMGYRAARTLLEIINGNVGRDGKYSKTLLEPELVIGETTGKCLCAV